MCDRSIFDIFLAVMAAIAVIVFFALRRITAGYGMMYTPRWGMTLDNRAGWIIMEAPVFIVMLVLWWYSARRFDVAPLTMFILFEIHYFQRSFIFPLLFRSKGKMPISIMMSGLVFNVLNAFMQGGWIFYVSSPDRYPTEWLWSPQFLCGTTIFFIGMAVNIHSDRIIRNLRTPGDRRHYIPRGGMFRYVSSANYFGEFIEWCGFAILTWSWAGCVFALWTFANLAPRAEKINKRYSEEFGEEFTSLKLKSFIPFIY